MIVHCLIRPVITYPYGIKMTGDRFIKVCLTLTKSLLNGTIATTFLVITSEHTILIINNGRHQIAFFVCVHHTLRLYHSPRFSRELIPNHREHLLQLLYLLKFHRGAGISLNATFSLASLQIAKKLLTQHVQAYHHVVYLYHNFLKCVKEQKGVD
jgi:hypothetical protein